MKPEQNAWQRRPSPSLELDGRCGKNFDPLISMIFSVPSSWTLNHPKLSKVFGDLPRGFCSSGFENFWNQLELIPLAIMLPCDDFERESD